MNDPGRCLFPEVLRDLSGRQPDTKDQSDGA